MTKCLLGEKIAVLVAGGFCEQALTQIQRALQPLGAVIRIISMDQGLVNSWNGEGWGLSFAADQMLSEALAADFAALVVPGGEKSIEKLQLTGHTRRFINGFAQTGKPAVLVDEAEDLLAFCDIYGHQDNILTVSSQDEACAARAAAFFEAHYSLVEAA